MKLHLPTGLRAALIAALTAVGTMAQAAITTYDITTWDSYSSTVGAAVVGHGTAQKFDYTQQFNTDWSFVVTVKADSIKDDSALTLLALSMQQTGGTGLAEGITLANNGSQTATLTSWSSAAAGGAKALDLTGVTDLTFVLTRTTDKNVTMKVYADDDFSSAIATATQGGQSFSNTTVDHIALGGMGGMTRYNHTANQVVFPDDANTGTFEITKAGYLFDAVITESDLVKYYTPPKSFTWNGTGTSAAWDTSSKFWLSDDAAVQYISGLASDATFGTAAQAKTVTVGEAIQVGTMAVQDNYSFDVSSSLTVDSLNVASGKKATFAGAGTITLNSFSGSIGIAADTTVTASAEINVAAGSTLDVSGEGTLNTVTLKVAGGTAQIASNLNVSGGGTGEGSGNNSKGLALTGDNGTANITDGVTNVTGAVYSNGNNIALNVGQGEQDAVLVANRLELGDRNGGAGTFVIGAHGKVVVKSSNDATGYKNAALLLSEWNQSISAQIDGELYARDAWLSTGDADTTINVAGTLAVKGIRGLKGTGNKIYFNEGGKLVLGGSGLAAGNGTWTIAFTGAEIGTYADSTVVGRNFTIANNVTFNTAMYTWTGEGAELILEEGTNAGAITVSGNIAGNGTIIKTGDGSLTLAGTENVIAHTITLQQGELVLSGTFDVSALATGGGGETKYVDGEVEGNGFLAHDELTAQVVNIATGATVSGEGTFTADGSVGTFNTATGTATFAAGASYTTLYVNVAGKTEGLAHAVAKAGDQLTTVILKDGTTLAADAAVTLPTLTVAENASAEVALSKDLTVTALTITTDDETLTLSGTGNITVGSLTGAGNLAYGSTGVMTLNGSNTGFTGDVTITNGTLKVGNEKALGEYGSQTKTITVGDGGTLDLNGTRDSNFSYILAGGTLTNTGADMGTSLSQTVGLQLTKDSTVEAFSGKQYWLRARGGNSTTLTLDGNTLVKTGDGTFGVFRCTVGTGTIEVRGGDFKFDTDGSTAANITFNGGTVTGSMKLSDDITLKALQKAASAANINADSHAITLDGTEELTLTGNISNATGITKTGTGTAVLSGTVGASPAINVNAGTLKATKAGALGSGAVNVAADATLDLAVDGILAGTQTVTSTGNVLIHETLASGKIDGGVLTLAGDFPVTGGGIEDVGGSTTTGNGFSQGGTMHIVENRDQQLANITSIIHGDKTYALTDVSTDGNITMSGADWSIYQLKVENDAQPTIQQIMDYADEKGEGTGVLKQIVVSGAALSLVDDSEDFKTSMLGGTELASLDLALVDGAILTMDADIAGGLMMAGEAATDAATIVLEKDAKITDSLFIYNIGDGAPTLTVEGAYTLTTPMFGTMGGNLVLQKGAKFVTPLFGIEEGDGVTVKDTADLALDDGKISIKSVDGTKDGSLTNEGAAAYDLNDAGFTLKDARITISYSDAAHDFGHTVSGAVALVNDGTSSVRDTNAANTAYDELAAQKGDIYLANKDSVTVRNLTLGDGRTVGAAATTQPLAITVNGTASFGSGATVGAALTMAGGAKLDGTASLANHDLSLANGLILSDGLWDSIKGLTPGDESSKFDLFTNVSGLKLAGSTYSDAVDLTSIFSHGSDIKSGKYNLAYDNGNVFITRNADNDRYWKKGLGDGMWNYDSTNWNDEDGAGNEVTFQSGYNAHFTAEGKGGENTTITLGTAITAASITVSGANYTFEPGDPARTLTVTDSVEVTGAHTATFNMALTGTEKLKLTAKDGGTLKLNEGGSVKTVEIGGGTVNVAASKTLTAGGVVLTGNGTVTGSLSTAALTGTGTLTMDNGSLTFTSAVDLTDKVDLSATGTSSITSDGVTLKFNDTVTNSNSLAFKGQFDVSNLSATDGEAVYVGGEDSANGFKKAQKIVSVISGGTATDNGVTFTYNGASSNAISAQGKVTFDVGTDYTKFYVNTGTEKVSKALDNPEQNLGTFELATGTTLEVDKNISMSMVNVATDKSATMQIDADKTVTTDGTTKALTLKGAGTLAVDAGKTATGVTLDNTWTGTVSFTEAELTTLDGAWTTGSTVSLTGVTGSLGNDLIEATVDLNKGTDDWGFGQTAAGTQVVTLNGAITGDGNLGVKSSIADSAFNLNGNIDGWTGNFIANADTRLTLGGGAKTVNGTVSGTDLKVVVNADTTFNGALNVENLVMGTSKVATLQADSTVDEVNASSGTLKVADGKKLTVIVNAHPEGIKLGVGSSIILKDDAYMGGDDYGYFGGTVANGTDLEQAMTINNAGITVTGTTLGTTGNTAFSVHNNLVNASFFALNELQQAVELANVKDSLEIVDDLAIGATGSLKVADGDAKQDVNISSASSLITAAGAQMDANLIINNGVTANMGGALDMNGGALTLIQSATLTGNLYDQIAALEGGDDSGKAVNLFTEVSALTLGNTGYSEPVSAMLYFSNLADLGDKGDYWLEYDAGTDIVSIRFESTSAHTLTWNGTEDEHNWVQDDETVTNWLEGDPADDAYFQAGDNAKFTADATVKTVTIAADIEARNITIDSPELYTFENDDDHSITAQKFEMTGHNGLAKTGEGKLTLDVIGDVSLTDSVLSVQEGSVEIGTAAKSGKLSLQASALEIAEGAELSVATIEGDKTSSITLDGTLTVSGGTASGFETSEGSLLKIADVGQTAADTLYIESATTLYGLENHGTLDLGMNTLSLMEKTEQGGNVTAGELNLAENGNVFNALETRRITYAYDSTGSGILDTEAPNLVVDTIAPGMVIPMIALDVTETMGGGGSLAAINRLGDEVTFTLIHANDGLGPVTFTLGEALDTLIQNGLVSADGGLEKTENDVTLTVGGLDLTWNTSKDETEWGYKVVDETGALTDGANTLNGVQHVVVDASREVDVTGVGSEPGLRVRNLTGLDGRTITFSGVEGDTVNLITTEATASNVNLAAENITVKVGLDALDAMDPVDYKDLRVGNVNLTGATLDVHDHEGLDDAFTVNTLSGDGNSLLKGRVIVEGKGGAYRGAYENANVILHENAEQLLYAGKGLTVAGPGAAKLAYVGPEAHMDAIEGIGMTVTLNDPKQDNSGATLVLDKASWLVDGTIVSGMSAINSAATLDTAGAPNLIQAAGLKLDGTTIILNQDAADDSAMAMAVNDNGKTKGLYLAHIGAEDSNTDRVLLNGYLYNKYYQNARLQGGKLLVDRREAFFSEDVVRATTENGRAGAGMLDDALLELNPQVTNPQGDLAAVMTALERGAVADTDRVAAAMAGASAAALGHAFNNDVQRQLRAIRNRTTSMGLAECTTHEGLPYVNAWVNAEGDYRKLDADGTLAGYTLSSWGGTIGCDVDLTGRLTVGAAFTVLHGEFTSHSADMCEGDLDRDYVSLFARYGYRAWTHTFVATLGFAKSKVDRTVNYGTGSYTTRGDSDGNAFGFLYEVGYTKALNEDASTCLQPIFNVNYRHSSLGGYTEKGGSDAALNVGGADMDAVTFGLGARLQSIVGTSVYNRATLFEGRVLAKLDAGDRDCTTNSSFIGVGRKHSVKSAEVGAFGVEVGAGLTIPVGETGGSIFMDVTGDFRSGYTEFNGTVGYRFSF